jgi:hypothetical protein
MKMNFKSNPIRRRLSRRAPSRRCVCDALRAYNRRLVDVVERRASSAVSRGGVECGLARASESGSVASVVEL